MGKESKGRQLKRGSEGKGAGIERKERRKEGLKTEVSMEGQRREDERKDEERTVDRAIEEMLTECYQKAFEGDETPCDYDLGSEFGSRKRQPSPPGRGRETAAASQPEVRSKQSAGMDRGQRQVLGEEELEQSTGEVWRSSQSAWGQSPRLDLKPCRGEESLTEHTGPASWQKSLRRACGEKESSWRELSPPLSQSLEVLSKTTRCGQSTEGIFPLPLPGILGWCDKVDSVLDCQRVEQSLWGGLIRQNEGFKGPEEDSGAVEGSA